MNSSVLLQLKELVFPALLVRAHMHESMDEVRPMELDDLEVAFDFRVIGSDSVGLGNLTISTKTAPEIESQLNYRFDLQTFAVFGLDPELNDAKQVFVRRFNAAATMVGSAREQLAQLTARGPWGIATLPMIPLQQLAGKYPETPSDSPSEPVPKRVKKLVSKKRIV